MGGFKPGLAFVLANLLVLWAFVPSFPKRSPGEGFSLLKTVTSMTRVISFIGIL